MRLSPRHRAVILAVAYWALIALAVLAVFLVSCSKYITVAFGRVTFHQVMFHLGVGLEDAGLGPETLRPAIAPLKQFLLRAALILAAGGGLVALPEEARPRPPGGAEDVVPQAR